MTVRCSSSFAIYLPETWLTTATTSTTAPTLALIASLEMQSATRCRRRLGLTRLRKLKDRAQSRHSAGLVACPPKVVPDKATPDDGQTSCDAAGVENTASAAIEINVGFVMQFNIDFNFKVDGASSWRVFQGPGLIFKLQGRACAQIRI